MARERKGGLDALLKPDYQRTESDALKMEVTENEAHTKTVQAATHRNNEVVTLSDNVKDEQITIKAPKKYLDIIDRYRYTVIMNTGNINYTKKEAFIHIMNFFEEHYPEELRPLPNSN